MTQTVKKNGVNYGIIIGVISIVVSTIMYVIDLSLFSKWWIGIIMFLVSLVIGIMAIAKAKSSLGGYISFKEAFTTFFIAMALGAAMSTIFMFILFNLIDPGAKEVIMEDVKEMTVNMMQGMGARTEDIRNQVEQLENTDNFSLVSQLKSYVWGLLIYIIIGLIVAAVMKKNKPEFE